MMVNNSSVIFITLLKLWYPTISLIIMTYYQNALLPTVFPLALPYSVSGNALVCSHMSSMYTERKSVNNPLKLCV